MKSVANANAQIKKHVQHHKFPILNHADANVQLQNQKNVPAIKFTEKKIVAANVHWANKCQQLFLQAKNSIHLHANSSARTKIHHLVKESIQTHAKSNALLNIKIVQANKSSTMTHANVNVKRNQCARVLKNQMTFNAHADAQMDSKKAIVKRVKNSIQLHALADAHYQNQLVNPLKFTWTQPALADVQLTRKKHRMNAKHQENGTTNNAVANAERLKLAQDVKHSAKPHAIADVQQVHQHQHHAAKTESLIHCHAHANALKIKHHVQLVKLSMTIHALANAPISRRQSVLANKYSWIHHAAVDAHKL